MDAPGLGPDTGINLPAFVFEETTEVLPEGGLQKGEVNEIVGPPDRDDFAFVVDAGARNKEMQMRVELQLLAPSVENGGKPADKRLEPLGGGEFFGRGG